MHKAENIDEFIALFPGATQKLLRQMRAAIKKSAPTAEEAISYGIPTFRLHGNLVHFSAYKTHIGFYPGPGAVEAFQDQLTDYNCSKGTIQFAIDKPLPLQLIKDIVEFRVLQTMEKEEAKQSSKKAKKPGLKGSADPNSPGTTHPIKNKTKKEVEKDFMQGLPSPAQRALTNEGIASLKQLSQYTEKQIRALHGMGPSTIPKLLQALQHAGLSFKMDAVK